MARNKSASSGRASARRVARLAQKGKGKKVRFQGGTLFPALVVGISVVGAALILSYYAVIAGWAFRYFAGAASGSLWRAAQDGFGGYSPGKWLCGVRVIDARTGAPIGVGASFKRNLPLLIPIVGQLIILIQMNKGPRLGDGWAHAKVIWNKYADKPLFRPSGSAA